MNNHDDFLVYDLDNKREFDSEIELKAHLQECLANMWDSLEASMHTI